MKGSRDVSEILDNPTYTAILLCIIGGENYAMSIARTLGKKQPTVTEQLKELEKVKLIIPLKRGKAQRYKVNWFPLIDKFYELIDDVFDERIDDLSLSYSKEEIKRIREIGWEKIVPPSLIKLFLKEYSSTLLSVGGIVKNFSEIIFSFFAALNNLDKKLWKKLVKEFDLDEERLRLIANLMEFELFGVELSNSLYQNKELPILPIVMEQLLLDNKLFSFLTFFIFPSRQYR